MTGTKVKSCGKRHSQCRQCSPKWAARIAHAAKGRAQQGRRMKRKPSAAAVRRSVPSEHGRIQHSSAHDDHMRTNADYEGESLIEV